MGVSRQQVVNLCERGDLPFVMVGKHRRVERVAVEELLRPRRKLTRDQLKSLWLHQAVAGSLVSDPDLVLGKAAENLDRLLVQHQGTMAEVWLLRWREKLQQGPGAAQSTQPGRGFALDPHDCVVSKLVAGREKDHAFANALIEAELIDPAIVAARIDTLEVDPRVMERLRRWIGMYTSAER